jgi:hypothetical protein
MLLTKILYVIGWALTASVATSSMALLRRMIDEKELPKWLRGGQGRRFASRVNISSVVSMLSMFVFGFFNLEWYYLLLILCGIFFGAQAISRNTKIELVLLLGPPILLSVNVILWIFFRRSSE